jgi:Ser/Thr protein kinase RdoA (MazF antagonist)
VPSGTVSITMGAVDDEAFREAADDIAVRYGLGTASGPLELEARGEQGVVWRLETPAGPYAVKELVMRRTDEDMAANVAFQERAAAGATSYDVARTMRTTDGLVLSSVGDRQIQVQSWLDMAGPDPSIDPRPVGRMLAELHASGEATAETVHPWFTDPVGAARWQQHVDALTQTYPDIAARLAAVVPDLVAFEDLLVDPVDLRTCHRDLWADNVRMTPSGRLCVFDWDNCGSADVDHELAMVVWEFGLDDADRIRAFVDSYEAAGGPGRVTDPGDFTMIIAQFGHFYEMAAAPFIDLTATEAERVHGVERFDEFDSRQLTMDAIGQIISVCGR